MACPGGRLMAHLEVWKVRLTDPVEVVRLPLGARTVHVDVQFPEHDWPTVWVEVDTNQPQVDVMFQVVGTGQPVATGAQHVGSVLTAGGSLVWHVYEVPLG